jgi:hypothetical protein
MSFLHCDIFTSDPKPIQGECINPFLRKRIGEHPKTECWGGNANKSTMAEPCGVYCV